MRTCTAFLLFCLAMANGKAQNILEVGTGWQNTGATRAQTWEPGIQGSRKDVPVFIGWRHLGEKKVFYTPTARLIYMNSWSIGGAMNLLSSGISPAGVGFYLSKPPAAFEPEARVGKWFIFASVNANFRFGVNLTPNGPDSERIPDPEAYHDSLPWLLDHQDSLGITLFDLEQRYPFGPYGYVAVDLPVQFHFTTLLKQGYGIGVFFEFNVGIFEWSLDGKGYPYAFGYNALGGVSVRFPGKKGKV